QGAATLPAPEFADRFTLARVGAPENVRLACQIRPTGPLKVTRLVRSAEAEAPTATAPENTDDAGVKKPLCLLYIRLRDADDIARDRLPYDVMFILNEFFATAGTAIDKNFGWVDKFFGEGVLAVFGQQRGAEQGAKDAWRAAQ